MQADPLRLKTRYRKDLIRQPCVAGACALLFSLARADVQILTQHNDPQRTGANLAEEALSPQSVSVGQLARLGSYRVDGEVYAQPLYWSRAEQHVLYVATATNRLYAFDADHPDTPPLWTYDAGSTLVPSADELYRGRSQDIFNAVGIIGTPVIDAQHQKIYFVAMTMDESRHGYVHTLHAVDLNTHAGMTAVISGSIIGGGVFNSSRQLQRAALALVGDRIYVAWSSFDDAVIYDGLVMSFDIADTSTPLKKRDQFQVNRENPDVGNRHAGGGIWHSGGGPAVDERSQFLYVVTGNGKTTGDTATDASDVGEDLDSSDVKLSRSLGIIDYFTPSFKQMLNERDLDLTVSGPMIPWEWRDRNGHPVRRLLHGSKQGILYNLNRDNLGHFHEHDNRAVQQVSVFESAPDSPHMEARHIHTTPVYWQSGSGRHVYVASDWGLGVKSFALRDDGLLNPAPTAQTGPNGYAIAQMSLSAQGASNGILWAIGCVGCVANNPPDTKWHLKQGVLLAYDAERLGAPLFTPAPIGLFPRFNAPTVANGRVFVPTFSGEVVVFGLNEAHFAAIWTKPAGPAFVARHGLTSQEYQRQFDQLVGQQGYCLVDVSGYEDSGQPRFAAIWRKEACPPFVARHGLTSQEYQQQFDQLVGQQGYRLKFVDGYTIGGQDRYAAIWEKSPGPPFVARHGLTAQQYQAQFDELVGRQGYCLSHVSGYAVGGEDRYAAIWEKKACAPFVAVHGLSAQQYQQRFDDLVGRQGYHVTLVNGHRINGQDSYAAIFKKISGSPAFVARHGLSARDYQLEFDELVGREGYGLAAVSGY